MQKLENVSTDLSKQSDVVDNNVVKKAVYDQFVEKANTINVTDASELVKKLMSVQILKKFRRKHLPMITYNYS